MDVNNIDSLLAKRLAEAYSRSRPSIGELAERLELSISRRKRFRRIAAVCWALCAAALALCAAASFRPLHSPRGINDVHIASSHSGEGFALLGFLREVARTGKRKEDKDDN
ncbi:MAG: hypothetical protein IJ802_04595 [Kiritimatiellae bacterium]|nr:hypothetical protein [Kiritimatiellia bacterium]